MEELTMKDAIMELINALTAGDMQKVIDSFAVIDTLCCLTAQTASLFTIVPLLTKFCNSGSPV